MQSGARRGGIAGVYGNVGIVESVTYRIYRLLLGSNPTLSAISKYLIKKTIHFDRRRHVRVSYVTASNCHNSAVRSKTRQMDAERHRPIPA